MHVSHLNPGNDYRRYKIVMFRLQFTNFYLSYANMHCLINQRRDQQDTIDSDSFNQLYLNMFRVEQHPLYSAHGLPPTLQDYN
jgi:hypothetical protein